MVAVVSPIVIALPFSICVKFSFCTNALHPLFVSVLVMYLIEVASVADDMIKSCALYAKALYIWENNFPISKYFQFDTIIRTFHFVQEKQNSCAMFL